jgi:DNA primase
MINIKDWCTIHLQDVRIVKHNIIASCPNCNVSNKQFAVNYTTGRYNCFREKCGFRGHNIKYLIAHVEQLSFKEVEEKYDLQKTGNEAIEFAASKFNQVIKTDIDSIKLPAQYSKFTFSDKNAFEKKFLTYLVDRGISKDTIEKFELGYCFTGKYEDRIIVPINTLDFKSFTGRSIINDVEEKYKNEFGEWKQKALVGYNEFIALNNFDYVIVCEGPFDCLKLYTHGFNCVALQGKDAHQQQINILCSLPKTTKIIIMLDPEVKSSVIDSICSKIYLKHPEVFVAKLELGIDPGSATKLQVMYALSKTKKWNGCV